MTEWLKVDKKAMTVTVLRHPNGFHCYLALKYFRAKGYEVYYSEKLL